jgi:hypothetical protein
MRVRRNYPLQQAAQSATPSSKGVLLFEDLLWSLYRRLNGRPPFTYSVARKVLWGALRGDLPLSAAIHTCHQINDAFARKHNIAVVRAAFDLFKDFEKLCIEYSAQYLPFSVESPEMAIRIPTDNFFVHGGKTIFPLFQLAKIDAPSNYQRGLMVGIATIALARAGFDRPEVWIVDCSELPGTKVRSPRIYRAEHLIIPNEHEINDYLSLLAEVHEFLTHHTEDEIRARAGRPPKRP